MSDNNYVTYSGQVYEFPFQMTFPNESWVAGPAGQCQTGITDIMITFRDKAEFATSINIMKLAKPIWEVNQAEAQKTAMEASKARAISLAQRAKNRPELNVNVQPIELDNSQTSEPKQLGFGLVTEPVKLGSHYSRASY